MRLFSWELTPDLDAHAQSYLDARSDADAQRVLDRLLQAARPLVRRQVTAKLGWGPKASSRVESQRELDIEDLCGNALVGLAAALARARTEGAASFGHVRAYLNRVVSNGYHTYLREKFPARSRLNQRVYDLLAGRTSQRGLSRWPSAQGEWLCGFDAWKQEKPRFHRGPAYSRVMEDPADFRKAHWKAVESGNLAELVAALCNWVGGPIEMDDLVNLVSRLISLDEVTIVSYSAPKADETEEGTSLVERIRDVTATPDEELETKDRLRALQDFLRALWSEIGALPDHQRAAVLLNLRARESPGEENALDLFRYAGVATLRDIARALGMGLDEEFAELWRRLPLEDRLIAERLGLSRPQNVINLRKSARERLMRRMGPVYPEFAGLFLR